MLVVAPVNTPAVTGPDRCAARPPTTTTTAVATSTATTTRLAAHPRRRSAATKPGPAEMPTVYTNRMSPNWYTNSGSVMRGDSPPKASPTNSTADTPSPNPATRTLPSR